MTAKLDRLLEAIHPERTVAEVARRTDDALNAFSVASVQITDWDCFRRLMIRFVAHVEAHLLGHTGSPARRTADIDFEWGRCCQMLSAVYGPNGEKAAFEMARTGNEGGLCDVLRKTAQAVSEPFVDSAIKAKVHEFWSGLSTQAQLDVAHEYLRQYGHLLPSELTEGSAARIKANMMKVLEQHPRMMHQLSTIGRR